MKKQWLSIILALYLLMSALPMGALAEAVALPDEAIEAAEEAVSEPGEELPSELGEVDLPAEPGDIELTGEEADGADWAPGYARVILDGASVCGDGGELLAESLPVGAVVYAFDLGVDGCVAVSWDDGCEVVCGWMDGSALMYLSMEETAAFLAENAAREGARCFDLEGTILLPLIVDERDAQPLAAGQYALELSEASLELTVGDTAELSVTSSEAGTVTWTSSDEAVATVSETGVVTAVAPGEAEITATAENGDLGVCAVTVAEKAEEVRYNQFALSMGVGERVRDLKVVKGDGSLYEGAITYTSSDTDVVAISSLGGMRGVKKGTAQITAATEQGTAVCAVTVGTAPKKLTLSQSTAKLSIGMTLKLETKLNSGAACHNYTYTSSNGKVASVAADGTITALAAGTAKITVRTFNDLSATCKVTVVAVPASVSLARTELLVAEGEKAKIEARALDVNGEPTQTSFTYTIDENSADPGCVGLDADTGEVTGVAKGSAAVKVSAHNGVQDVCQVRVVAAPAEVRLPMGVELGVGEKLDPVGVELIAPEGEEYCAATLTWSSDNKRIAKVNANTGAITGVKAGTTTIRVKTHNGRECGMEVVVRKAPSKVTAVPTTLTLGVGERVKLGYKLPSGSAGRVTFTSSKPDVLSVDREFGQAEALAPGKAKVTIKTYNGKKATVTVTVMAAPTSIALSETRLCLGKGETVKLGVILDEGAGGTLTYELGDSGVASVSNGSVTGVSLGDTRVTVSTYNGLEAVCDVTVKPAPTSVTLPCKALTLGVGETWQLTSDLGDGASALTYKSSNAKLAKVTAKGLIKGVNAGSANITVKTFNGQSAKVKVTVKAAPSKVTLTETDRHLGVGESFYIGWKIPAGSGGKVTMESTDPSVVSLDESGLAVGRAVGTAEIVARVYNGKEARCKVTVHAAPTSVDLGGEVIEIGVGQSMKLKPVFPGDGWSALKYSIDNTAVAKVSADGTVKALKAGTATLTATTYLPDVTGTVTIRSIGAPDRVSLEKTSMEMNVDETYQLVPIIPENTMAGFTYKSSKTAVAEVDANGLIRTKQRGKATITVATHNGKTAKLALTVYDPWYPEKLVLDTPPKLMDMGETYQATYTVTPAEARAGLVWTSSNEKILSVDQNGLVTAKEFGYATITVTSERNSKLSAKFRIGVRNGRLTLDIPLRQTDIAGIPDNLAMIENIRLSAISEVDRLQSEGTITQADADRRKRIINKAFQQYAFPWMTPKFQIYWNTANSQGGVKDFKPGIVYYGLPYISGLGANRNYTAARALNEKRYTDSGKGYYLLNQDRYVNGKYCGTDCSGNVAVSIWGTSSSRTADRTDDLASNAAYKSSNFKSMRPGDIIVRSGGHALFFMYYCSVDKDFIMIMEQGGNEFGTNTVHCSVFPVSYFTKRDYVVRRLATLG